MARIALTPRARVRMVTDRARRTRGSALLGQGTRYLLAGGTVTAVYFCVTTALADIAGLPFQAALAIGACTGVLVHFTLQRSFVWARRGEYALALHHQVARYLVFAGAQYAITAASTAILPGDLGLPVEAVYLGTMVTLVSMNFLVFRNMIFHPKGRL